MNKVKKILTFRKVSENTDKYYNGRTWEFFYYYFQVFDK